MNKEVTFEIAKLLKEKGFDSITNLIYMTNHTTEVLFENINQLRHSEGNNPFCSAPTIAEVVMWLYETHGIWISVQRDWDVGKCLGFEAIIDDNNGSINTETFNSPTEAYEAAIKYILENLIQGGNNEQ